MGKLRTLMLTTNQGLQDTEGSWDFVTTVNERFFPLWSQFLNLLGAFITASEFDPNQLNLSHFIQLMPRGEGALRRRYQSISDESVFPKLSEVCVNIAALLNDSTFDETTAERLCRWLELAILDFQEYLLEIPAPPDFLQVAAVSAAISKKILGIAAEYSDYSADPEPGEELPADGAARAEALQARAQTEKYASIQIGLGIAAANYQHNLARCVLQYFDVIPPAVRTELLRQFEGSIESFVTAHHFARSAAVKKSISISVTKMFAKLAEIYQRSGEMDKVNEANVNSTKWITIASTHGIISSQGGYYSWPPTRRGRFSELGRRLVRSLSDSACSPEPGALANYAHAKGSATLFGNSSSGRLSPRGRPSHPLSARGPQFQFEGIMRALDSAMSLYCEALRKSSRDETLLTYVQWLKEKFAAMSYEERRLAYTPFLGLDFKVLWYLLIYAVDVCKTERKFIFDEDQLDHGPTLYSAIYNALYNYVQELEDLLRREHQLKKSLELTPFPIATLPIAFDLATEGLVKFTVIERVQPNEFSGKVSATVSFGDEILVVLRAKAAAVFTIICEKEGREYAFDHSLLVTESSRSGGEEGALRI